MSGLKFFRQVIGLIWIIVFFWGVAALFSGDWAGLVLAVVLWFVIGLVFSSLHSTLQRTEARGAHDLTRDIAVAVAINDWHAALALSERTIGMLRSSAYRDKTALGKGNGQEMMGPYGMSLIGHGFLLGGVGRLDEAQNALDQGIPLFARFDQGQPEVAQIMRLAREVQDPYASSSDFANAARQLYAFS